MGKPDQLVPTTRDRELLEALARRVRLFSLGQVARTWWPTATAPRRTALARLRALERASLVNLSQVLVHPELPLDGPIVSWTPTLTSPDFAKVAYRLQNRWKEPLTAETIVVITNSAAPAFGGYPSPALRTDEITHDLHLAAVYLKYRAQTPSLATSWIGELIIRRTRTAAGGPVPDAMIRGASHQRIVEFGGAYSKQRVRIFHTFCQAKALPYELW